MASMALCLALDGLISGCCLRSSATSVAINWLNFFFEHLLDAISRNSFCTSKVGLMIGIQELPIWMRPLCIYHHFTQQQKPWVASSRRMSGNDYFPHLSQSHENHKTNTPLFTIKKIDSRKRRHFLHISDSPNRLLESALLKSYLGIIYAKTLPDFPAT